MIANTYHEPLIPVLAGSISGFILLTSAVLCIIIILLHQKHKKKVVVVETREHDFQMSPNEIYVPTEQNTKPEIEYAYVVPASLLSNQETNDLPMSSNISYSTTNRTSIDDQDYI